MLGIDNITGVSFSDFMVDEVKMTLSIRQSLKNRFTSLEEVKQYCKSLSYTIMYLYSREEGFVKINLTN